MSLVYSAFVPHPPIIIPEIGRGEEKICAKTLEAYKIVARSLLISGAEHVIVVSPHAQLIEKGVTILQGTEIRGDFEMFGQPGLSLAFLNDEELGRQLQESLPDISLIKGRLDHGALVPLYFLQRSGWNGKVLLMSMPLTRPEWYGQKVGEILRELPERYALIVSGDLSHRLREDGPYGFDPSGPRFDGVLQELLKKNPALLGSIPEELAEEAAECGFRSLLFGVGAKEGAVEILSYEGPFGVGYMVAELYRSSPLPKWARTCLLRHLEGRPLEESEFPHEGEFAERKGCFVTLKTKGELRGCIGTTEAWQKDLAHEIQHNAIAAGTEDPRFWPVEAEELKEINFSVDVLGELEKIEGLETLDPYRYGVVVRKGRRSGLLLPHLEGVDTVEEQVGIAKQKAGIPLNEEVELWRFEVVRHFE